MNKKINEYIRLKAKRLKSINYLGGKCKYCGDKNTLHLTFHHIMDKNDCISLLIIGKQWNELKKELDKCELVCKNCHYEIHFKKNKQKVNCYDRCSVNKKTFLKAVNKFQCEECEYNKCYDSLDFHHIENVDKKGFDLGNINKRFSSVGKLTENVLNELDKCKVVCKNCHGDIHTNVNKYKKYENLILEKMENYKENNVNVDSCLIRKLHGEGKTWKQICTIANVSKATISKYLNGTK